VNAAGQPIVNFSWTAEAASSNLLEYFIYEGMTPGFTPTSADIFSATPSNTLLGSYVLSSTPGTYYFAIAPRDTSGNMGPASNIVSLTVGAGTSMSSDANNQTAIVSQSIQGLLDQLSVLLRSL
jgi:hypothetical protein